MRAILIDELKRHRALQAYEAGRQ
jgi:integrase